MLATIVAAAIWLPAQEQARVAVPSVPLDEPSPRASAVWDFSRDEARARVLGKLSGSGSYRAWHFAKILLAADQSPEVVEDLIGYLEKQRLSRADDAPARNAIEVMQSSGYSGYSRVLLAAAQHPLRTLREAALKALARCADAPTVDKLIADFDLRDVRTQALMLRVVAQRWPTERAIGFLRRIVSGEHGAEEKGELRFQVVQTFTEGAPDAVVRGVLQGNLGQLAGLEGKALPVVAKLLHAAGSDEGRSTLLRLLTQSKDPAEQAVLILALAERDAPASRDVVEPYAAAQAPDVRVAVARFLAKVPDQASTRTLEVLANAGESQVRKAAVVALGGRASSVLDRLVQRAGEATGSDLREALDLLIDLGEARAVPVIVARLAKAHGPDRRVLLQALGRLRCVEAVEPLVREFLAEPVLLSSDPPLDSVSYAAVMLTNIATAETRLWSLYEELRLDEARRSHLLQTLATMGLAPDAAPGLRQRTLGRLRALLLDEGAPDRDRQQALGYIDSHLTLDDAMALRRLLRSAAADGSGPMHARINDYLWEFF